MKFPVWLRALLLSPPVILIASATRLLLISNNDPAVAMKIAQSGGVTGTLIGTIIPLLPPFLPVFVAFLLVCRNFMLATVSGISMAFVATPHTSLGQGVQNIKLVFSNFQSEGPYNFLLGQSQRPVVLAVGAVSFAAALVAAPRALRNIPSEEAKKQIDKEVEAEEPRHQYKMNRNGFYQRKVDGRLIETSPEQRFIGKLERGRAKARKVKWARGAKIPIRGIYAGLVALAGTAMVGVLTQFYTVFPAGVDLAFHLRRPWLPLEVIESRLESKRLGYVISASDGWFTVLDEKYRTIQYLPANEVVRRTVCSNFDREPVKKSALIPTSQHLEGSPNCATVMTRSLPTPPGI